MNEPIEIERTTPSILIIVVTAFGCLGLLPTAHAVIPPPDGGYAGENTAEGTSALLHLRGGIYNTAVGWASLGFDVSGNLNTAVGAGTLLFNTADGNTAIGVAALLSNTTGFNNTGNGTFALFSDSTGSNNTAIGYQALFNNTDGFRSNAAGFLALSAHQTGNFNNAFGSLALASDQSGASNNAFGDEALTSNTSGTNNMAMGDFALHDNTTANANTSIGFEALKSNTIGDRNCALGAQSLQSNTEGQYNTVIGERALSSNTTGSFNTVLGTDAGLGVTTAGNVIVIGSAGANVDDSCYIANIWNQPGGSQPVYVNSEGKLGPQVSARHFKDEIKPMGHTSEMIYGLRPVSFRYKTEIEPTRPLGFGLIAEEVEEISPDLVTRSGNGKPNSVRYDAINAMLLNEFFKEHKAFVEEKRKVQRLEGIVESLVATVKKQAVQIQTVSTRVDASRSASQAAVADQ